MIPPPSACRCAGREARRPSASCRWKRQSAMKRSRSAGRSGRPPSSSEIAGVLPAHDLGSAGSAASTGSALFFSREMARAAQERSSGSIAGEGEDLEEVGHDHVAMSTGALVASPRAESAQASAGTSISTWEMLFGARSARRGRWRKRQGEDVLGGLLAREVVDQREEDLGRLIEDHSCSRALSAHRGHIVGAEGLLHDDPQAVGESRRRRSSSPRSFGEPVVRTSSPVAPVLIVQACGHLGAVVGRASVSRITTSAHGRSPTSRGSGTWQMAAFHQHSSADGCHTPSSCYSAIVVASITVYDLRSSVITRNRDDNHRGLPVSSGTEADVGTPPGVADSRRVVAAGRWKADGT